MSELQQKRQGRSLFSHWCYSEKSKYSFHPGKWIFGAVLVISFPVYASIAVLSSAANSVGSASPGSNFVESSRKGVDCLDTTSEWIYKGRRKEANACQRNLRVFVYDLPRKFNFGLFQKNGFEDPENELPWNSSKIPEWPGGNRTAKHQHSVAYYMYTDLLQSHNRTTHGSMAVRVSNPEEADVFFVPFFSSLSFNRFGKYVLGDVNLVDKKLQEDLVQILNGSEWWQRSSGRDHVIPITHPNSMRFVRSWINNAIFVVVDFGRYDWYTARLTKDVVSPYNHLIPKFEDSSEGGAFERRKTLLFFQGTVKVKQVGRFRTRLYQTLRNETGVELVRSAPKSSGFASAAAGMRSSKFCLHISGDTPSSCRLFDAIMSRCVPVVVSDLLDLPFEDVLDYHDFAIFVPEKDALTPGVLVKALNAVGRSKWLSMWRRLGEVQKHFEFHSPAVQGDAVDMIWDQIYKKLPIVNLYKKRRKRLVLEEWWDFPKRARRIDPSDPNFSNSTSSSHIDESNEG